MVSGRGGSGTGSAYRRGRWWWGVRSGTRAVQTAHGVLTTRGEWALDEKRLVDAAGLGAAHEIIGTAWQGRDTPIAPLVRPPIGLIATRSATSFALLAIDELDEFARVAAG